jgi:hypothetical protein
MSRGIRIIRMDIHGFTSSNTTIHYRLVGRAYDEMI